MEDEKDVIDPNVLWNVQKDVLQDVQKDSIDRKDMSQDVHIINLV